MPAPWAYFDTSVIVKRYVREHGSIRARNLLRHHRLLSSAVSPAEATSAFCRRRASGELADRDFIAILSRRGHDRAFWELVEVSPLVLDQAEELIRKTPLRTLDAIHVASALAFQASSGIQIHFVTGDRKQAGAAKQSGLDVVVVD